jgi:hypothetical protein
VTGFLKRLMRISTDELRFRCAEQARVGTEAILFACRREPWERERLRSRLVPTSPELVLAQGALASRDWRHAHAALCAHFMSRAPRFLIDPARCRDISAAVVGQFPSAIEEAVRRASRLLDGRHDILGYRDLTFRCGDKPLDWHFDPVHQRRAPRRFWARVPYLDPQFGDHKIVWEVNRHQHWLALGRAAWLTADGRYPAAFAVELDSWLRDNPPLTGTNWSSMLELAFRSISWIWALHFFAPFGDKADSPWLVDLLLGLDRQLHHVARHLSVYFSPNTHLLGEGLALYVAGRVLPELSSAPGWEQIGRRVLIGEASTQVHPDGGHAELSTHYHRYALDFYLLALVVARRTGDPAADRFAEVASRMASFCRALAGDDGRLPTIGDDDGGLLFPLCGRAPADASDSLSLAAALLGRPGLAVGDPPEEVLWMLGGDRSALQRPDPGQAQPSQLFPASGYAVIRSSTGHAILDAGRHGFLNGGHAHADALSLVLSVHSRPLLIDPGTATYTTDAELRDRFRSTAMHNTVVMDGQPQSVPASPFHWRSSTNARVDLWRTGAEFDFIEALHDGYARQTHRRAVLRGPAGLWLVADHVLGTGPHRADAHWHVDSSWTLERATAQRTHLAHPDGLWAAIVSTAGSPTEFHGDAGGLGWCAPVYGRVVPSLTLRFSEAGQGPFSMVTAISAATGPVELSMESTPVAIERQDAWHRVAVAGMLGDGRVLALFATSHNAGLSPVFRHDRQILDEELPRRAVQRVNACGGELVTDARMAILRISRSGEPISLGLIDASVAAWTGRGNFSIGTLRAAEDLHLDRTALDRLSRDAEATRVVSG